MKHHPVLIEDLIQLRDFLNSRTEEELEKMSFEIESFYWDDYWWRLESEEQAISHITFDNGCLICHPYKNNG